MNWRGRIGITTLTFAGIIFVPFIFFQILDDPPAVQAAKKARREKVTQKREAELQRRAEEFVSRANELRETRFRESIAA